MDNEAIAETGGEEEDSPPARPVTRLSGRQEVALAAARRNVRSWLKTDLERRLQPVTRAKKSKPGKKPPVYIERAYLKRDVDRQWLP